MNSFRTMEVDATLMSRLTKRALDGWYAPVFLAFV
jgi:hypothetical protein